MTTDKEQRLESAIIKILRDEGISFGPSNTYSDVKDVAFEAIKSEAAREYWQSKQQETPELEEIKRDFYRLAGAGDFQNDIDLICVDKIWAHFAPYIKGMDAVEFAEWIRNEGWEGRKHVGWINHNHAVDAMGNRRFYVTKELYDLFKSLPKAPKEVGGE